MKTREKEISKAGLLRCDFPLMQYVSCMLVLTLAIASCSAQKERVYQKTMILMDTLVTINVVSASAEDAEKAMDRAFAGIGRLARLLDFFSDGSEISLINRNAGTSKVRVSPETLEIIEDALYASEKTHAAFDPTIGPVMSLWDFHSHKMPGDAAVVKRLPLVDYRLIGVDRNKSTVSLGKKGMLMDLGAIAKGFAADKAVEDLKMAGIRSGLVAVAGDIRAFGLKPDGKPWRVGIKNPRPKDKDDEIMATVELNDAAISTSGDYERYFIVGGRRYHHILDPKTGYPATGCRSVTVISKKGYQADSFSTGVFVLGPEKGMEVLVQTGLEGLIIDKDGGIKTTPGLRGRIEFKGND